MNHGPELPNAILTGDRRALSRAITIVESDPHAAEQMLSLLPERSAECRVIGLTGAPGTGKSSLADLLAVRLNGRGRTAVLAFDPTSPLTGGALLGDRLRMAAATGEEGIFIRSLGSRGSLGGLSAAAEDSVTLIAAAGFSNIVLETVGMGQLGREVAEIADITVLVMVPESGDVVQAMKAGIIEYADMVLVNKSDRPGASTLRRELESVLRDGSAVHPIQVLEVSAAQGKGIDEALDAIVEWFGAEKSAGLLDKRRRERFFARVRRLMRLNYTEPLDKLFEELDFAARLGEAWEHGGGGNASATARILLERFMETR